MQSDPDFWWNWPVQLGVAIGTLLAFGVALFGPWFQARFFPPILKISLVRLTGERTKDSHYIPMRDGTRTYDGENDSIYFHLRVTNLRRRSPATNTLVYLSAIAELEKGYYLEKWTGNAPVRWRHPEIFTAAQIVGPHIDCDLLSVSGTTRTYTVDPTRTRAPDAVDSYLSIFPLSQDNNLLRYRAYAGPINVQLSLQARSNEVDSELVRVRVVWDGKWSDSDEEMKEHLQISLG